MEKENQPRREEGYHRGKRRRQHRKLGGRENEEEKIKIL
jgi:hypothetical protein